MRFRSALALLTFLAATVSVADSGHDPNSKVLGACAAFAADGSSAAVTFNAANISLDITDLKANVAHLNLPLRYRAQVMDRALNPPSSTTCDAYVSRAGDLVAIGIANGGQLQVAVASLKSMTWVGDWGINVDAGFKSPSLAGFLEATSSLVVGGEPSVQTKYGPGTHWGVFTTALFDPDGKQLMPPRSQHYADDGHIFRRFPDASHNLLWVFLCEPVSGPVSLQPLCPIVPMSLTGDQASPSEFNPSILREKRTDLWFYPDTFAVPDSKMILFGEGTTIWGVNLQTQTSQRLILPKPHFPSFEAIHPPAVLSPDAQVLAVALDRSRLAFPFLVDTIYRPAFAVYQRQGSTTVLAYRHDRWERDEVYGSPNP